MAVAFSPLGLFRLFCDSAYRGWRDLGYELSEEKVPTGDQWEVYHNEAVKEVKGLLMQVLVSSLDWTIAMNALSRVRDNLAGGLRPNVQDFAACLMFGEMGRLGDMIEWSANCLRHLDKGEICLSTLPRVFNQLVNVGMTLNVSRLQGLTGVVLRHEGKLSQNFFVPIPAVNVGRVATTLADLIAVLGELNQKSDKAEQTEK